MKRNVLASLVVSSLAFALLTGMFKPGASVTNAPYGCNSTSHRIAIDLETGEKLEVSSDELRTMPHQVVAEKSTSGDFYISHESIWSCAFYYVDEKGRYQSHILAQELVADSSDYEFDEVVEVYSSCVDGLLPIPEGKRGKPVLTATGLNEGKLRIEGVSCLGLDGYGDYNVTSSTEQD